MNTTNDIAKMANDANGSINDAAGKANEAMEKAKKEAMEKAKKEAMEKAKEEMSSATKRLDNAIPKIDGVESALKEVNVAKPIVKMILSSVPNSTWKSVSAATLDKICDTVRDAEDGDEATTVKLQIIVLVNKLMTAMVEKISKEKMQKNIEREIMNKMMAPFNELFDKEYIQIKMMHDILTIHGPGISSYLTTYLNSSYIKDQDASERNIYDYISFNDMKEYEPDSTKSDEGDGAEADDAKAADGAKADADGADGGYGKIGGTDEKTEEKAEEKPDAPGMPPMSPEIKLPNVNLLGNIAETAKTILESLDLLIAKMIDQNLTNQVDEANTTDAADSEEPRFIDELHQKIITAATYHLEKPEGRQMYLRQVDKLLTQSTSAITGMNSIIGPLFAQCLQSESIQTCIKTTIASIIGNEPDAKQNNKYVIRQEDIQQFVNLLTAEITNLYNEKNIIGGMYTLLECNKVDKDTLDNKKTKDNEHPLQGGKQNKSSSRKGNRKGNRKNSRNQQYLPKKNNHTRKKH